MNSMYFDENSRERMISLLELLLDMSYDDSGRYNDIHIKPEDCGAFSVEWSQEHWSEPDGEFKYAKFIHLDFDVNKCAKQEDNVIKPNTNWETKTMLLNAEQEDELRNGIDSKYLDIDLEAPTTIIEAKPNWYVDYNEPYKHYVDYNEPYKYNVGDD